MGNNDFLEFEKKYKIGFIYCKKLLEKKNIYIFIIHIKFNPL